MNAISFQRSYVKVRVVRTDSWISYTIETSFRAFFGHRDTVVNTVCLAPCSNPRFNRGRNRRVLIARPLSKRPRNLERAAAKFQSGYAPRIQTDGRLITDYANRFQLQSTVIRKDKMEFMMGLSALHFSRKIRFFCKNEKNCQ